MLGLVTSGCLGFYTHAMERLIMIGHGHGTAPPTTTPDYSLITGFRSPVSGLHSARGPEAAVLDLSIPRQCVMAAVI
jgi:hypothetical protein